MKLTYFDFKGRAEPIRIAFAFGGVEYEDDRFKGADWPQIKPTTPFGQVPNLTVEGKVYTEGFAILRYAGKKAGLYPSDDLEALRVDEVLQIIDNQYNAKISQTMGLKSDEEKKEARVKLATEVFPSITAKLNEYCDGGHFANSISIADIAMSEAIGWVEQGVLDNFPADFFNAYPNLVQMHKNVREHPNLKSYFQNRK